MMRVRAWQWGCGSVALLWSAVSLGQARGDVPGQTQPREHSAVTALPERVDFDSSRHQPSPAEAKEIQELITKLVEIDTPDIGIAPYMSGGQFAPIADSRSFAGGILGSQHLVTPDAVKRLVALGPKALPLLIASIDDTSPTKLTIHNGGMGAMWHSREADRSTRSKREADALLKHPSLNLDDVGHGFGSGNNIDQYTVTRGDVCFVLVGQIVNRGYSAVRYQPTGCQVINSPSTDAELAGYVRDVWQGSDAPAIVFQSLLDDLKAGPEDYSEWARVPASAMRLLYYFPEIAEPLVIAKLDGLPGTDDSGWRDADLLEALGFCDRPAVVDAMVRAAERGESHQLVPPIVTAMTKRLAGERVLKRAFEVLHAPKPIQHGPFDATFHTLAGIVKVFPERGREAAQVLLDLDRDGRKWPVIVALRSTESPQPWAVDMLKPFLDDETPTGWEFGPNHDRRPYLIKHFAAESIAHNIAGLHFDLQRERVDPDDVPAMVDRIRRAANGDLTALVPPEPDPLLQAPVRTMEPSATRHLSESVGVLPIGSVGAQVTVLRQSAQRTPELALLDLSSGTVRVVRSGQQADCGRSEQLRPVRGDELLSYERSTARIRIETMDPTREPRVVQTRLTPCESVAKELDCPPMFHPFALTDDRSAMLMITAGLRLLSVSTIDGNVSEVWKHEAGVDPEFAPFVRAAIYPMEGTDEFLVLGIPPDGVKVAAGSRLEEPVRVWNHAAKTMRIVEKVPAFGIQEVWGTVAFNFVNQDATLWDLSTGKQIKLPFDGREVVAMTVEPSKRIAFIAKADGSIAVVDLTSRRVLAALTPPPPLGERRVELVLAADRSTLYWISRPTWGRDEEPRSETLIAAFDVREFD